jgi:hypothetical protein
MTLTAPAATIERDRWGRPRIQQPDGKTGVYTRATTISGTLDDRHALEKWLQRQVAVGLGKRPDLVGLATATPADDKEALNQIVEDATDAAASDAKANLGTALHALTEQLDRGHPVDAPQFAAEIAAYQAATRGCKWLEIEQMVVHDPLKIAGTPDRIGMLAGHGRPAIVDLKTGSIEFSGLAIAIQLAIYANSNNIYQPDGTRLPMPDVDRQTAYVIHLPVGAGTCTIHAVDIEAGWEAAQTAIEVRDWRKRGRKLINRTPTVTRTTPPATDEGATMPPEAVDSLLERFQRLDGPAGAWVSKIGAEAHRAGVGFRLKGAGSAVTARRIALMDAVLTLAEHDMSYDDSIVGVLEELQIATDGPAGQTVGRLDHLHAHTFLTAVNQLVE